MLDVSNSPQTSHIFIVTGYSGAGKSTVLRALEDNGFLCVDNLPTQLLSSFFSLVTTAQIKNHNVALGLDVRTGFMPEQLQETLASLGSWKKYVTIFFLTSSSRVILKRFQETRRAHPLAQGIDIAAAIEQEHAVMKPFMEMADVVINTDQCNVHQLRNVIRNSYKACDEKKILVSFISFGFKFGVPPESNFVLDVTSLPNPYFVPELKNQTGLDAPVQDYLFQQDCVTTYWHKCLDFIKHAIARSHEEGRLSITIAIGCTGGRHRSVAFVNALAQLLFDDAHCIVKHRDIDNEASRYESPLKEST